MNSPEQLARVIEDFLAQGTPVVVEDGAVAFDFAHARYSLSSDHGKCVLHLWSAERNSVRRVLDAEITGHGSTLRLSTLRFGQTKPVKMEFWRDRERRSGAQCRAARQAYQQRLRALLERCFSEWTIERLTCQMDLKHSFSSVYTRGLLKQGSRASALLGVGGDESQAAVDGALTFGLLWLDYCRQAQAARCHVEGLKMLVPPGRSALVRERMAHLNPAVAKWQLFEYNEREGTLGPVDTADRGNVETRLAHCPDSHSLEERFAASLRRVRQRLPQVEIHALSSAEIAFRWRGLEFARARMEPAAGTFQLAEQIRFGIGPRETVLTEANSAEFDELISVIAATRRPEGDRTQSLWRATPERWLESVVIENLTALDDRFDPECIYSQVPAFAASDRAVIDVLARTRDGRLAVIELKADEDIHLPLQAVDYWARVEWHRTRGEFERHAYFAGRPFSPQPAMLLLVAPALRVHPATDTLLRYLSPEIDLTLLGIDERWREQLRVVFRKRPQKTCGTSDF